MNAPINWILADFLRGKIIVPVGGQVSESICELYAELGWLIPILLFQETAPKHRLVRVTEGLSAHFDSFNHLVMKIHEVHRPLFFHQDLYDCLGDTLLLDAVGKQNTTENVQVNYLIQR